MCLGLLRRMLSTLYALISKNKETKKTARVRDDDEIYFLFRNVLFNIPEMKINTRRRSRVLIYLDKYIKYEEEEKNREKAQTDCMEYLNQKKI